MGSIPTISAMSRLGPRNAKFFRAVDSDADGSGAKVGRAYQRCAETGTLNLSNQKLCPGEPLFSSDVDVDSHVRKQVWQKSSPIFLANSCITIDNIYIYYNHFQCGTPNNE